MHPLAGSAFGSTKWSTMTILDYLDALAGAGKTRWIVNQAHRRAIRGFKVLIVQPSKLLIAKTVSDELAKLSPVRHKIIDGDHGTHIVASIVAHFRDTLPGGEILFITHSAFFSRPVPRPSGSVDRPDGRSARCHRLPRTALARQ
jgi:hypothetical protein